MSSQQTTQQGSIGGNPKVFQEVSTSVDPIQGDIDVFASQKKNPTAVGLPYNRTTSTVSTVSTADDDKSTVDAEEVSSKRAKVAIAEQGQRWCATLNNPGEQEAMDLFRACQPLCKYIIMGLEGLEHGKTLHWQCFFKFNSTKRLAAVKKLNSRAHWERTVADDLTNVRYCLKEGNQFLEHGTRPVFKDNGEREKMRWDSIWVSATLNQIMDIPAQVRVNSYPNLMRIAKDYMAKPSDLDNVCGEWLFGIAGAGKSRTARAENPDAYFKNVTVWWDGYQNEDAVIIDDVDKYHVKLGHLLKIWADRYSFIAETKGSAIHIRPKKIVVTSQYSIEDIWDDEETRVALNRRFKSRRIGPLPNFPIFNKPELTRGQRCENALTSIQDCNQLPLPPPLSVNEVGAKMEIQMWKEAQEQIDTDDIAPVLDPLAVPASQLLIEEKMEVYEALSALKFADSDV